MTNQDQAFLMCPTSRTTQLGGTPLESGEAGGHIRKAAANDALLGWVHVLEALGGAAHLLGLTPVVDDQPVHEGGGMLFHAFAVRAGVLANKGLAQGCRLARVPNCKTHEAGERDAAILQICRSLGEANAGLERGEHGSAPRPCGFGQLGPDGAPVVGAQFAAGNCAARSVFNVHTTLNWYAALFPITDSLRGYAENFSQPVLPAYAIGSDFNGVFFLHARHGTRKV